MKRFLTFMVLMCLFGLFTTAQKKVEYETIMGATQCQRHFIFDDGWEIEKLPTAQENVQIIVQHKTPITKIEKAEDQWQISIQIDPDASYKFHNFLFFSEEYYYTDDHFTRSGDTFTANLPEGTYTAITNYSDPAGITYLIFTEDIQLNQNTELEILANEAKNDISVEFYDETGEQLTLQGYYDGDYEYKFCMSYVQISIGFTGLAPQVKMSNVDSDMFSLSCFITILPVGGFWGNPNPPVDNAWYYVVHNPVLETVNDHVVFRNKSEDFTKITVSINQDSFELDDMATNLIHGYMGDNGVGIVSYFNPNYITSMNLYMSGVTEHAVFGSVLCQPYFYYGENKMEGRFNDHLGIELHERIQSSALNMTSDGLINNTFAGNLFMPGLSPQCTACDLTTPINMLYEPNGEMIFENVAPLFYIQHLNGFEKDGFVRNYIFPYGRSGELRELDYWNSNVVFKCDDNVLFSDALNSWTGLTTPSPGLCELTISTEPFYTGEITCQSIATLTFDQRIADKIPPSLSMFRVLNKEGAVSQHADKEKGRIEFTAGDYYFQKEGKDDAIAIYQEKPVVEMFYSIHDADDWQSLAIEEIPDNFDPVSGNFFESVLTNMSYEKGWMDIKIIATDESGNKIIQEILPAFYLFSENTGINEKPTCSSRAYPNPFGESVNICLNKPVSGPYLFTITDIMGKSVYSEHKICNNQQQFIWNGTTSSGQATTDGIYIYRIQTNGEVITGKIMKYN